MKYFRPALLLFAVAFLAYGVLIPRLGFYWDELPMLWIRYQLGTEALTRYFSSNRPVWGVLHQLTTRLLPMVPVYWQVFALVWRWLGAVVMYAIALKLWQGQARSALGVALLFLVYPGFNQHWAAYLYGHFYIVLFFFLCSFLCMLLALEAPHRYWAWTAAGVIFSALNLWMMEYFYVLELARVGVLLVMLRAEPLTLRARLIRVLKLWAPYVGVFALSVLYRLFIFNNQVYGIGLTSQLRSAPVATLKSLLQNILLSLRLTLKDAWLQMFTLPEVANLPAVTNTYHVIIAVVILIAAAGLLLMPRAEAKPFRKQFSDAAWMMGLGLLAVLLAGGPFLLIGFQPSLQWPASRFTLPFLFGVSLLYGGLISVLPWEKVRITLLVALVSLAAGKQYLSAREYQQDWVAQKNLFWQMSWRVPALKPDTLVLLNEGGLKFYADNSLGAALNWIYAPDNHSTHVEYVLFYPKTRLRNALPELKTGIPITYDYLAAQFNGNTSQTLAMYYAPPGCLRILDSDVEHLNRLIPETSLMRFAASISDLSLIVNEPQATMPAVYGPEPEHDFCYYFERADLARQFGDWDSVVQYAESALSLSDHPFDPAEQFVFIEGYAHAGDWERAIELSVQPYEVAPTTMGPMLCRLWRRIGTETTPSVERSAALSKVASMFACDL